MAPSGIGPVLARSLGRAVRPYSAAMSWARRAAVGCAVLAALHLVAAVCFLVAEPNRTSWLTLAVGVVVVPAATGLSVLISRRREGALVGVLLGLLSLAVAHVVAKEIWLQWLATTDDPDRWSWLVAVTAEDAWWILTTFGLLLLHFPDGRVPSRRWRWVPATMVIAAVVTQVQGALVDEPFRAPLADLDRPFGPPPGWWELLSLVAFVVLLLLIAACAVSLVLRFRRADRTQRQQIKWLALAGIGMPLYPLLCLLEIVIWGEPLWFSAGVGIASLVATPVAAAIAVLRHDLYDVDKALGLAVTWGLVTALLLGVYAAVSSVVGVLIGRDSETGVAIGTAAAALLLLPALRVVRRAVDARMYPLRRAALAAVDDLHHEISPGRARPERLEAVLRDALRDPGLRVGFRVPGSELFLDADGEPVLGDGVPVQLVDEETGVFVRGSGPASIELLREVAARSATLVEVVRLRYRGGPRPGRGRVEPRPAGDRGLRRAPPPGARPARWCPAATGLPGHGAAARAAAPRRRDRRRGRAARPERRRAGDRGLRAAPDRARAAAEPAWTTAWRRRCRAWSAACR